MKLFRLWTDGTKMRQRQHRKNSLLVFFSLISLFHPQTSIETRRTFFVRKKGKKISTTTTTIWAKWFGAPWKIIRIHLACIFFPTCMKIIHTIAKLLIFIGIFGIFDTHTVTAFSHCRWRHTETVEKSTCEINGN